MLGSCVAVCLFDPALRAGGINHYLLPYWNGEGLASPKYANIALPKLLEKMLELGCRRQNLRAKLFGGGAVFQQIGGLFGVGERNIQFAEQYLADAGIPVVARDVGRGVHAQGDLPRSHGRGARPPAQGAGVRHRQREVRDGKDRTGG